MQYQISKGVRIDFIEPGPSLESREYSIVGITFLYQNHELDDQYTLSRQIKGSVTIFDKNFIQVELMEPIEIFEKEFGVNSTVKFFNWKLEDDGTGIFFAYGDEEYSVGDSNFSISYKHNLHNHPDYIFDNKLVVLLPY